MEETVVTGMILDTLPFRDHDQILTVFSKDEGIVKVVVKKATKHQRWTNPLTVSEFICTKGRSELWTCKDIAPVDLNNMLRSQYDWLETACDFARSILKTQWPGKPAPLLYQLLTAFIKHIPHWPDSNILKASFRLKILRHEGLFHESLYSNLCEEEKQLIIVCALSPNFELIKELGMADDLFEKVCALFDEFFD